MPCYGVTIAQQVGPYNQVNHRAVNDDMSRAKEPVLYRNQQGMLVADTACTWEIAKNKLQRGDLEFGRSQEVAQRYKARLVEINSEWDCVDSYSKHTFLNYPFETKARDATASSDVNQSVKYVPDQATNSGEPLVLVYNDFPYYLASGIAHCIVWSTNKSVKISECQAVVEQRFSPTEYECLIFENLHRNKSVKTVAHVHAFVRERKRVDHVTSSQNMSHL